MFEKESQIENEYFYVRPKKTAPIYINLRKIYKVKRQNIRQDKIGVIHIYIEELNRWMIFEYFKIDPINYN
jgi:hypothetical protein